jgi:glutamate synthase (NADPH/NADH) small chain
VADPRGFLKVRQRETQPRRPVPVRIMDWKEVYEAQEKGTLKAQAGRCMDCGVPFCHQGCPLGNLIPEWNDLMWRDKGEEAIERLHATNNFPEFTGRLCPAPCEASCVLGINQPAVTIKQVEVSIIDEAWDNGWVNPLPPARLTGKTVAVVGSGPAGLAVAQQLTRVGHTVAVYERDDKIGGLLRYGIPDFKMEKEQVDRRVEQMKSEGTRFRTGVAVGTDVTWEQLRRRYDAVVVCTGATVPRDLPIPGRDLHGVHFAMDYLVPANRVVAGEQVEDQINAQGKHVVILGGGDTGS